MVVLIFDSKRPTDEPRVIGHAATQERPRRFEPSEDDRLWWARANESPSMDDRAQQAAWDDAVSRGPIL